jgi:huntingtin interacting protein 1
VEKVMSSILGPQRFEVIVDREKFEKDLHETLTKALSGTEAPPKEKHVRNALIATWREKGCASFWKVARQFPVLRSHIVCWKTCFVIHRTFRDGYPDVVKKSAQHLKFLSDVGKHWSHAVAGFAPLNTAYIKVLMLRISFYVKNPEVPGNLNFDDKEFTVPTDIDIVFQLAVEVFDLQSALLHLYAAVIASIDPSRGVTAAQIQCRLAPLIPAIQDSAALYDLVFKLMKALHAGNHHTLKTIYEYYTVYTINCYSYTLTHTHTHSHTHSSASRYVVRSQRTLQQTVPRSSQVLPRSQ